MLYNITLYNIVSLSPLSAGPYPHTNNSNTSNTSNTTHNNNNNNSNNINNSNHNSNHNNMIIIIIAEQEAISSFLSSGRSDRLHMPRCN